MSKKDAEREVRRILAHMSTQEQRKAALLIRELAHDFGFNDATKLAPVLAS